MKNLIRNAFKIVMWVMFLGAIATCCGTAERNNNNKINNRKWITM